MYDTADIRKMSVLRLTEVIRVAAFRKGLWLNCNSLVKTRIKNTVSLLRAQQAGGSCSDQIRYFHIFFFQNLN